MSRGPVMPLIGEVIAEKVGIDLRSVTRNRRLELSHGRALRIVLPSRYCQLVCQQRRRGKIALGIFELA